MNYTSAVSIIPGGCPLDAKSLGRFWAYFREIPQTGESAIASARRQVELVPVPLDDTGQPGDYDYKIDANRALEAFTGRWVPVPFLRLSNKGRTARSNAKRGRATGPACTSAARIPMAPTA